MKQQVITEKLMSIYDDDVVTEQMLDDMLFEATLELIDMLEYKDIKGHEVRQGVKDDYWETKKKKRQRQRDLDDMERQHDNARSVASIRAQGDKSAAIAGGVAQGATTGLAGAALFGLYAMWKKYKEKKAAANTPEAKAAAQKQMDQTKVKIEKAKKKKATAKAKK